ncbi:cation-transporting ATPase [Kingella kingae]|nr:cation-transporting ATPase [Kingella kingae]
MQTPLCAICTRRSLSPCPNLNLIHYIFCYLNCTLDSCLRRNNGG